VNVLIDTSVWSLAFRRKSQSLSAREKLLVQELSEIISEGRARILGLVRQELLSGIKTAEQYETPSSICALFATKSSRLRITKTRLKPEIDAGQGNRRVDSGHPPLRRRDETGVGRLHDRSRFLELCESASYHSPHPEADWPSTVKCGKRASETREMLSDEQRWIRRTPHPPRPAKPQSRAIPSPAPAQPCLRIERQAKLRLARFPRHKIPPQRPILAVSGTDFSLSVFRAQRGNFKAGRSTSQNAPHLS
jgi:hypothetical protein